MASEERESDAAPRAGSEPAPTLEIFINYRRQDSKMTAQLLYDRLAPRFGAENVFLDRVNLQGGMQWVDELRARGTSCGAFLALIGRDWMSTMKSRSQSSVSDPAEDFVRLEIERALRRRPELEVIPVIVGDDVPPPVADRLPRSLAPLARLQCAQIRPDSIDQDCERLIARLEQIAREGPTRAPEPTLDPPATPSPEREPQPSQQVASASEARASSAPAPSEEHYEEILRYMVDQGAVVPLLGPHLNAGCREEAWQEGLASLPDAEELAADLAQRFDIDSPMPDLAAVAQHVLITSGPPDLYKRLRKILSAECAPGPAHLFLARFRKLLEARGLPPRHQMIVTTNYDTALERAFDAENEPYDLAVYMSTGPDAGKFVHFPYEYSPVAIHDTHGYGGFPIDEYGDLDRTVIVKIHGAVDGQQGDYAWKENYVIAEDHYIDYLSHSTIGTLVPIQLLGKLTDSHCLFLGYVMRDWALRVFLKRIWEGQPLASQSWAIEQAPDVLERKFWNKSNVELFATPLSAYVDELTRLIAERSGVRR